MARYTTSIASSLAPEEAFAFMADFTNTEVWDPSVVSARRVAGTPPGVGSSFDLVTRFAGREVPLTYVTVEHRPFSRVVLAAQGRGFDSVDTITVEPAPGGSTVTYDAVLRFGGVRRLLDPVMQRIFNRVGDAARAGMVAALGGQ